MTTDPLRTRIAAYLANAHYDVRNDQRADAILALVREAEGWRAMDSAPRDGTPILAAGREEGEWRQEVVWFEHDSLGTPAERYTTQDGPVYGVSYFEYWRPLPAPPGGNP